MTQINQGFSRIERDFNILGSIPLVSTVSGSIRIGLGSSQLSVGLTVAVLGVISGVAHPSDTGLRQLTKEGFEHMIHGALNIGRGTGEALCGITIVGSAIPLTIQLVSTNGFNPRFTYGTLSE